MNFLLKSKPKNRYSYKTIFAAVFFITLLILSIFFSPFIRSTSNNIMRPFWILKDKSINSFNFIGGFFSFKSSLIKENEELKKEVNNLRLTKIDYEIVLRQNQEIKESYNRESNSNPTIASVLSKPPQSPFDTFVLDAGASSGISLGDKAYISDTIIVGTVVDVTEKTSLVKLFSSSGQETEVFSFRTGSGFVLKGDGGSNFEIEVPKDADIIWGDNFIYPGLKTSVIATVYFVDSNSQSSFKTIHLKIPGNVFQTKRMYIVK